MYPHHRDGSPTRWDKFAHLWLSNVAIVPTVRVSAIALVLLKSLKRRDSRIEFFFREIAIATSFFCLIEARMFSRQIILL